MTFTALLTPKGRKATAQLAKDLTKITGKVAVAGTATMASALAGAMASSSGSSSKPAQDWFADANMNPIDDGFQAAGPEGPGYYENGFKMGD